MAIGDVFGVYIGPSAGGRTPASGCSERISAIVKGLNNDAVLLYDNSTTVTLINASLSTYYAASSGSAINNNVFNMQLISKEGGAYIYKTGSSNRVHISGVQIDGP